MNRHLLSAIKNMIHCRGLQNKVTCCGHISYWLPYFTIFFFKIYLISYIPPPKLAKNKNWLKAGSFFLYLW